MTLFSGGELRRCLDAGADPSRIVFAGVGKTRDEIRYALKSDILFFTVESEAEARRISECAVETGTTGRIAFRGNPDVDPKTHKYISTGKKENKFGLDLERLEEACEASRELPGVSIVGFHMHIGSQLLDPTPFAEALERISDLCTRMKATYEDFEYLDIGGGLGIAYEPGQEAMAPETYASIVVPRLKELGLKVLLEPGRSMVGNSGVMLTEVQYVKESPFKTFVIVDAAMNDLLRPSLYQAYHEIVPVRESEETIFGDCVGPICESGDFIAQDRDLPLSTEGDLLAVRSAGAYAFSMASNYNSRGRPAEIMVDGSDHRLIRKRETIEELMAAEECS